MDFLINLVIEPVLIKKLPVEALLEEATVNRFQSLNLSQQFVLFLLKGSFLAPWVGLREVMA